MEEGDLTVNSGYWNYFLEIFKQFALLLEQLFRPKIHKITQDLLIDCTFAFLYSEFEVNGRPMFP